MESLGLRIASDSYRKPKFRRIRRILSNVSQVFVSYRKFRKAFSDEAVSYRRGASRKCPSRLPRQEAARFRIAGMFRGSFAALRIAGLRFASQGLRIACATGH